MAYTSPTRRADFKLSTASAAEEIADAVINANEILGFDLKT